MNNEISLGKKKPQTKNTFPSFVNDQSNILNQTIANSMMVESKISGGDKQRISFHPKELIFNLKNVEERQFIEVRNVTKHPLRLKIIRPKTKYFRVVYDSVTEENYMLCPGLTKKIQIEYKKQQKPTTEDLKSKQLTGQIYDSIKLQLENKSYEINLQAVKQAPSLTYDKLIDMKFVDMNKLLKMHKKIVNNTNEPVRIKLTKESYDSLHVYPQQINLKPQSEEPIEFSITPTVAGTYHHKILVQANNTPVDPIQIVYSTYEYHYSIADDNGNKVSELDFGYLYFGSKKVLTLYAVNNTPNAVQMKGKIRIGKNNPLDSTFQSPQEFGQECSATLIQIQPKNIKIQPFSKQKFILSTTGKITQEHIGKVIKFTKSTGTTKGIKTHKRLTETIQKYKIQDEEFHECFLSQFSILNNKDSKDIKKKDKESGHGSRPTILSNIVLTELKVYYGLPKVKINPADFDFGKVTVGKPVSTLFSLTNQNDKLPAKVTFNKIVGVEIFPKDAFLNPSQTKEFQIFVTANSLGVINETLKITLEENFVVECRLKYEAMASKAMFKVSSAKERILHRSLHHDSSSKFDDNDDRQSIDFNKTLTRLQKTCHNQVYRPTNKPTASSSLFNIRKSMTSSLHKNPSMNNFMKALNVMNASDGFKTTLGGKSVRQDDRTNSILMYEELNSTQNGGNKKKIDSSQIREFEEECTNTSTVKQQVISLPTPKESLFVTKKIDKYEPYAFGNNSRKLLKSKTSKDFFSAAIKRQPRNRRQAQEISMQLKGQALKLIKINTKNINFGKMFVGSKMQKEFIVENDTEYSIEVKLRPSFGQSQLEKLENEMLTGTDYGEQIVPSHGVANFRICLFAKECGKFEKAITYVINKVHEFQFLVEAEIELAALTINKNTLKMSYLDDQTEMYLKDSFVLKNDGNATTEFSISQQNQNFIIQPSRGIVEPGASLDVLLTYKCAIMNVINAGESVSVSSNLKQSATTKSGPNPHHSHHPSVIQSQNFMDERISVDIKNGINMSIKVTFNPNITEPKCIVKQQKLNFGVTIVSKPKQKSFLLRNLSRTMTLFQIQNSQCSQFLFFDLTKGKLPPESSKQITVTYKSSHIQQIDSSFKINIRGGLTITMPILAESVAPNIRLLEDAYSFGDVCCGSSQVKMVSVANDSETVVELLLDLLDKKTHGMEYLFVSFIRQQERVKTEETNQKPLGILKKPQQVIINPTNFQTQQEMIIDNALFQPQIHKLKIQPKSVYKFYLVFQPKLPGYYEFELPLYFENFIKNQALNKIVTCFATEPKFIVEPSVIRFKKKIISEKESTTFHPLIEFITLKNPGDKQLKWKIDCQPYVSPSTQCLETSNCLPAESTKTFQSINPSTQNIVSPILVLSKTYNQQPDNRFCFEIENKKGTVKPQSRESINIAFNPFEAGMYCYKLPLLIYNEERGVYQQQAEIRLQGEGQYPTLFFDRKEVIMPVVPLGVESVAMFKLINQGYESISLKHRIQIYDMQGNCVIQGSNYYQNTPSSQSIPEINVIYPQGVKMGLNKKELYIIVKFVCKKPISFTCKLQLFDNTKDNRVYSIPVSGTTDSSILTLFTYLNDTQNRYKFVPSNPQPAGFVDKSKKDSSGNYVVNLESTDDRNAVDKYHNPYEKATVQQFTIDCEIIRRWINSFLKDEKVSKFPEDVIASPENFLKLLSKMTGRKQFDNLISILGAQSHTSKQGQVSQIKEPLQTLFQQKNTTYFTSTANPKDLLSQLFSIPSHFTSKLQFYEYLIRLLKSMGCLLNHIRPYFLLQKEEFFAFMEKDPDWKNMSQTYTKNYEVMHLQAWIVLFYQVVNNFWYNTSKLKNAMTQSDKAQTFGTGSPNSNVYSVTEMTVLRWVKGIYEKYNDFDDTFGKFMNFGQDFKDSLGLIYAIYHHIINPQKKKKCLQGLTKKPSTSNQITSNIRILYQLIQKVGLVPLIYEEEFPLIKQKEMFLFIYQLYELLPQQLPKTEPVEFKCNLGEKCTKFIEIKNSSSRVVNYWVKLEGSRDFSHEEKESIRLEPKSVYKFKVNFVSRVSQEEIAYLSFLNKQQANENNSNSNNTNNTAIPGCTLVFELKSKIIGRKSIKKLQPISCPLYESQMIRIPIQNHFDDCEFANFEIHLFEEILDNSSQDFKPRLFPLKKIMAQEISQIQQESQLQTEKKSMKREQKQLNVQKQDALSKNNQLVNFFVEHQTIKIKKNTASFIQLLFNPVLYQKIKCYIIFHDPSVGEFQYEIIGISQMPKILQQLKHPPTIYTTANQTVQVNIPAYNNFMIKANMLMEQKVYTKNGRPKPIKKTDDLLDSFKIQVNMDQKILQYVTFPQEFCIKNSSKLNPSEQLSKLKINCLFPVVIKDLALDFLLINVDKTDVRRIKLHLNIASKPVVSDLIIKTTARVPIVQPIPIENTSEKDWRIKATITEDEQSQKLGYFSLKESQHVMSKDFVVKKGSSTNAIAQLPTETNLQMTSTSTNFSSNQQLHLVFAPKWACKLKGKLQIHNITTNQQLIYHIKASCEEPVSQGHIHFKVKTSTQEQKKITIKNPYAQALTYNVETDIEDLMKVPQFVYMDSNSEAVLAVTIESLVPSKNVGYLKFTDDKGRFFWYTLTIESYDDTNVEKSLEMSCEVGQTTSKLIDIYNSTNQKQKFQIALPEHCCLTGPQLVDVDPHETMQVPITFKPTQVIDGNTEIRITNKNVGPIIYKVALWAKQPPKKTFETLSAEVNKSNITSFKITNSLKTPIKIRCELSTSKYFELQYNEIVAAKSDGEVMVEFKPLEEGKYSCTLKIYGDQLQIKCYEIQGIGLKPFSVQKIDMKTGCQQPVLEIIKFKNPNPKQIKQKVQITLQDQQFTHNCFSLITDKGEQRKWQTAVSDFLAVPIQFKPSQKGYFQSMVYIRCAHYEWKYMLKGTTQTKASNDVQETIQGQCRKQVMKIIKLPIPNYLKKQPNFSISMLNRVEIQCNDPKNTAKVKPWINIKIQTPIELEGLPSSVTQEQELTLMFKLNPLQPIEQIVTFNIFNGKSQGSIRLCHKIKLLIKPSEPEQVISIDVSSIKKYKFDLNLEETGVIAKMGQPIHCMMKKNELVECRFKKENEQSNNLSRNLTPNTSQKSLFNQKSSINNNSIVEVTFSPNNLIFNSTKGKNQYSDILMIYTDKNFWSCQILFKQNTNLRKSS